MAEQTFTVWQRVRVKPDATFLNNTEPHFRASGYIGVIQGINDDGAYLVSVGDDPQSQIADIFTDDALVADHAPTEPDDFADVRARVSGIKGFVHQERDTGDFAGHRALAELDDDGKTWKLWDMDSPYSFRACDFIAHAPDDLRRVLDALDAVTRERDAAVKRAKRAEKFFADIDALTVLSSSAQFMNAANELLAGFTLADETEYHRIWNEFRAKETDHANE